MNNYELPTEAVLNARGQEKESTFVKAWRSLGLLLGDEKGNLAIALIAVIANSLSHSSHRSSLRVQLTYMLADEDFNGVLMYLRHSSGHIHRRTFCWLLPDKAHGYGWSQRALQAAKRTIFQNSKNFHCILQSK